jgi:hypothetical protein
MMTGSDYSAVGESSWNMIAYELLERGLLAELWFDPVGCSTRAEVVYFDVLKARSYPSVNGYERIEIFDRELV